jgi:uncharacterized protein
MTCVYVDGDACPVKAEVEKVAARHGLVVTIVSNGGLRPSANPLLRHVTVAEGADAADDWIAERITSADICVTNDIPLASRCLKKNARALAANGKLWTENNIGNALAGREVGRYLRETGVNTGGPPPFSKADRSRFLNALDAVVQAALRG